MRDILVAVDGAMEGRTSEDLQDLVELAQQASTAYGTAPGEGFPEMDQFLNDVRFKIVNGQMTPEEGAKELESAAEAVRNRSQRPDQITVRPPVETRAAGWAFWRWRWAIGCTRRRGSGARGGLAKLPDLPAPCACLGLGWCSSSGQRRRSTRSSWWCPASSPSSGARCAGTG